MAKKAAPLPVNNDPKLLDLVKRFLLIKRIAFGLDLRKKTLVEMLENYFAPSAVKMRIATMFGVVVRDVKNEWIIDGGLMTEAAIAVGKRYNEFFTEKIEYKPTAAFKRAALDPQHEFYELFNRVGRIKRSISIGVQLLDEKDDTEETGE